MTIPELKRLLFVIMDFDKTLSDKNNIIPFYPKHYHSNRQHDDISNALCHDKP
jgi:hypothetical protein